MKLKLQTLICLRDFKVLPADIYYFSTDKAVYLHYTVIIITVTSKHGSADTGLT